MSGQPTGRECGCEGCVRGSLGEGPVLARAVLTDAGLKVEPAPPPPATDPHEPKESRPVPTREEFENALNHYCVLAVQCGRRPSAEAAAACVRQEELLEAAFDAVSTERDGWKRRAEKVYSYTEALKLSRDRLTAERDEWKRRAEEAEAEAVRIAQVHQHEWVMRAGPREAFARLVDLCGEDAEIRKVMVSDYDAALARAEWESIRATKAEAERDAARKELDEIAVALGYAEEHEGHVMRAPQSTLLRVIAENARARGEAEDERDIALRLVNDPRVEAWRVLTEEQRSYRVEDLRTWADMVEAGAAPDGADHGPSPLRIAAAALEALGERP